MSITDLEELLQDILTRIEVLEYKLLKIEKRE